MEIFDASNPNAKVTINLEKRVQIATKMVVLETGVEHNEAKLDEFFNQICQQLTSFQLKLNELYHKDKEAYDEMLKSLSINGEFKVEIVDDEVKLIISEDPITYLDSSYIEESKFERFKVLLAYNLRVTYLQDISDALHCLTGDKNYDELSKNGKDLLAEIVTAFADADEKLN